MNTEHNRRAYDGLAAWKAPSVIIQMITAILFLGAAISRMSAFEATLSSIPNHYVRRDVYVAERENLLQKIDVLIEQTRRLETEIQRLSLKSK